MGDLMYGDEKKINDIKVSFRKEKILESPPFSNWIGKDNSASELEKLLDQYRFKVKEYALPKALYTILEKQDLDIQSYSFPGYIMKSDFVAIGALTIGEDTLDDEDFIENSLLDKMIVDALENYVLNQALRKVVNQIKDWGEGKDLNSTRVISPGGGSTDWGIENQDFIMNNLNTERIGVRFKKNYLLRPQKSLTFTMGLGKNVAQAENLFSCEGCKRYECPYRI